MHSTFSTLPWAPKPKQPRVVYINLYVKDAVKTTCTHNCRKCITFRPRSVRYCIEKRKIRVSCACVYNRFPSVTFEQIGPFK
jgi:hypothetical protein